MGSHFSSCLENLPTADNSVDVVISHYVINQLLDKKRVFRGTYREETYRAIKPGDRIMVSDITLLKELLPTAEKRSIEAYVGYVARAVTGGGYLATMADAGFQDKEIIDELFARGIFGNEATQALTKSLNLGVPSSTINALIDSIISMKIRAIKSN